MSALATEHHLTTQRDELRRRYDTLSGHIVALSGDVDREFDSERKLVLRERLSERQAERDRIVRDLERVERHLDLHASKLITQSADVLPAELPDLVGATASGKRQELGAATSGWLQKRLDAQFREGRISASEWNKLEAMYYGISVSAEALRDPSGCTLSFETLPILEGEALMASQDSNIINLAEALFIKTRHSLAQDLKRVVELHFEWPELLVGDPTTDKSIEALTDMAKRMALVDGFAVEHVAPSATKRFQMERNGLMNSANQLVFYLEESSSHMVGGRMPWNIFDQMKRELDELSYYTNRCVLWLDDLAQSVRKGQLLQ